MEQECQIVEVEFALDGGTLMSAEAASDMVRRWISQACAAVGSQVEIIDITVTHQSFWRPTFPRPAFYTEAYVSVVTDADLSVILEDPSDGGAVPRPGVIANAIL